MAAKRKRGLFITFEGGEGVGKSSQIKHLARKLEDHGLKVCITREPGGTPGAEIMRHVILSGAAEKLGPNMEAVLFAAARADHVDEVIRPALNRGETVLCDRFYDSTRVYQGATGNVEVPFLKFLETIACGDDCHPDLTIVIDLDPQIGLKRAEKRRGKSAVPDRFEKETLASQKARRQAFLDIAAQEPDRFLVVDGNGSEKEIATRIFDVVQQRLNLR